MNARRCRVCGKPLSRMRVGGDEFCSREHQNQFRMRQGMDRLMEANKVASLMRRRENPKPVSTVLPSASGGSQRSFPPAPPRPELASEVSLPRPQSDPSWERAPACPPSEWTGVSQNAATRAAGRDAARFFAQGNLLLPRRTGPASGARFRPASVVPFKDAAGAPPRSTGPASCTLFASARLATRISIGGRGFHFRASCTPGFQGSREAGARPVAGPARQGRQLRVSASSGFRIAEPRKRPSRLNLERAGGADALHSAAGRALGPQCCEGDSPAARSEAVGMPFPVLWSPPAPSGRRRTELLQPGAARVKMFGKTGQPSASESRFMRADSEECVLPPPGMSDGLPPFPEPRPHAAVAAASLPGGAPRSVASPFTPRDAVIRPSRVTIQGIAAGLPAMRPRSKPAAAATSFEDHFAKGWGEWMGDTGDWKVDIAGVRTGSLLLFRPSMELSDYQLEFLARIEKRSVNWVFRASGFDRYYLASITAAPDGSCEFTRRTVVDGVAGPVSAAPVHRTKSASHALTVRTSVSGAGFAVYVDGARVDHWGDNRLAAGGIGFVGTPEDRARLYWVKISLGGSARSQS